MSTANLSRDEARTRSEQIKVNRYEFTVDVSAAKEAGEYFPVVSTVRFTSTAPDTWLDFLDGIVDGITVNGTEREVEYDGARLQVRGLRTDGENVVAVAAQGKYSRSGQGLHRFVDPADGETYLYTQYEPADSRRVFPNFEQPDLKAHHVVTLVGPKDWQLLSNQPPVAREEVGENAIVTFAPTPLLSTYITCIAAGPYAEWRDEWSRTSATGETLTIPLGVYCRRSLAKHMDPEAVFEVTKQGLAFFDENFGFPYPWGKYDSIFVPEYNLGAMENPGLVTFTEKYVFRSTPVRAQLAGRCNTIQHEMSHMWFGDLVTPQWWDDLWLKESFAEYMGAHCSAAATQYGDAWVAFAGGRKNWAYQQDQLPTTHPIVADIPNLEAAKQNFDGITYAKGAAVLKQLVAWVGVDEFFAGARAYFAQHAFSSTTLADLLSALEAESGRDLADWSRRWLQTAGVDRLEPVLETSAGQVTRLEIRQTSDDAMTGQPAGRPHRLGVGLYSLKGDRLVRTHELELDVDGGASVDEAVGLPAPDLVLLNDRDLSYAKVRFDPHSLETALAHVCDLDDPLARALVWGALWDMTRDAELPATRYVRAVLANAPAETDSATLMSLLANAVAAMGNFVPAPHRAAIREEFADRAWELVKAAEPGSDAQQIWMRYFAIAAATTPAAADRALSVVLGREVIDGLDLGPDIRWGLLKALSAIGADTTALLGAELERDNTNEGAYQRASALAGRPLAQAKADAWRDLHVPGGMSNDVVDATIAGFAQPLHAELVAPYADAYFAGLEKVWADFPIEISQRLVRGLYPLAADAIPGEDVEDHPSVIRSRTWLEEHPDAPAALRRIIREQHDHLLRALRAQAAA